MAGIRLSDDQVDAIVRGDGDDEPLSGWVRSGDTLTRSFEFATFAEAFGFMTQVALAAERLDHHPDWSNSWNKVEISITNHDAGGITDLCIDLARRANAAA